MLMKSNKAERADHGWLPDIYPRDKVVRMHRVMAKNMGLVTRVCTWLSALLLTPGIFFEYHGKN